MYHEALLCFFFILFISVNYISPGFCEGDSLHPAYIYYSNYTLYSSIEYSNYSHHYYIGFKLHVYWDDNEDVITVTGRLWWSYNFCILRLSSASCFARVDSAEIASRSSLTFNNMQFNALWRKSTQVACISPRALIKMSWSLWSLYPSCKSHWLLRAQFTWSSKDTLSDGWRCFHFSGGCRETVGGVSHHEGESCIQIFGIAWRRKLQAQEKTPRVLVMHFQKSYFAEFYLSYLCNFLRAALSAGVFCWFKEIRIRKVGGQSRKRGPSKSY